MRLIGIANISNGEETIGFRLLDMDTKQTKDVPIESIKQAIKSNNIQIDNLEIKAGIISGSNGSIDRLPKIINGQLIEKSPLIILNQIGETSYEVSDFKGSISNVKDTDIIEYANKNGISNGKIVTKDGRSFISAISGSYVIKNIQQLTNKEPYTGELITKSRKLLPVLLAINVFDNSTSYAKNVLVYYHKEELVIHAVTKADKINSKLDISSLKKGLVTECSGCTIFKYIIKPLSIEIKADRPEIEQLLKINEFRAGIHQSITRKSRKNCEIDKETDLPIPAAKDAYQTIEVRKHIGKTLEESISPDIVEKYLKYLKIMKARVKVLYIVDTKGKIALNRTCTSEGIYYNIYKTGRHGAEIQSKTSIEDIYYSNTEYDNVTVSGTGMSILGLDGEYSYDMGLIFKTYNKALIETNRNIKAIIFDSKYNESVNELGELKNFRTNQETIHIPNNVKEILAGSIVVIPSKNRGIIFGDSIEKCELGCFNYVEEDDKQQTNLISYIEIGCSIKATSSILNSMRHNMLNSNSVIHFTRDITPEEYAKIILDEMQIKKITSSNQNNFDDRFIFNVVQRILPKKANGFNLIDKPLTISENINRYGKVTGYRTTRNYRVFLDDFEKFITRWNSKLAPISSDTIKNKVNTFITETKKRIEFRESEYRENEKKMLKQLRR